MARRLDQQGDISQEPPQLARCVRLPLDAAEGEEPFHLLLGHGQLPEGDVQRLVPFLGREPFRVELDAHPGPGQRVPQLVGQPGRELGEQPGSLRLPDRLLHLFQLIAHAIN